MPACHRCGFELPDSGPCQNCGAARSPAPSASLSASHRAAATVFGFLLPFALCATLIAVSAIAYCLHVPDHRAQLPEVGALGVGETHGGTGPTGARGESSPPASIADPFTDQSPAGASSLVTVPGATGPARSSTSQALALGLGRQLPIASKKAYLAWMLAHSSESRAFLERKWDRAQVLLTNKDITNQAVLRAFLYTPREFFVRSFNLKKAYDNTAIPIGFGQTISGPHMVANMTEGMDLQRSDRVLEIGTGSGYQSALLSELCDHVYTIEIVPPLFRQTDQIYRRLSALYPEYGSIVRENADGYFGWIQYAPFQKIIVTAGIDHIPPPLLRQLAPNGIMIIPVGPPSGQTVLRIVKRPLPGGGFAFERSDIYHGRKVIFVPFTSTGGSRHSLDDSGAGAGQ